MFEVGAEGFSCSLDVFHGGLRIKIMQFLINKKQFFLAVNFYKTYLIVKTLDPDPKLFPNTH